MRREEQPEHESSHGHSSCECHEPFREPPGREPGTVGQSEAGCEAGKEEGFFGGGCAVLAEKGQENQRDGGGR